MFRSENLLFIFITAFCIFSLAAMPVAAESHESSEKQTVVFFYGKSLFPGDEVHTWTTKNRVEASSGILSTSPTNGVELGFEVQKASGEKERVSGVVDNGKIRLSNGAIVAIQDEHTVFDVMVNLKLHYLKKYTPNFFTTG